LVDCARRRPVIDTATNKVTTAEVPGTGSGHGVVAPDGKRAYYLHGDVPTATPLTLPTIDTATNGVSTDVDVGGAPVNSAIFA
jgi:DNA-binding beta-propeller fold protein YncE